MLTNHVTTSYSKTNFQTKILQESALHKNELIYENIQLME